MSRLERPAGLAIMEKLMGIVLLVMGGLAIYYTYTSLEGLGPIWAIFMALAIFLIILGIVLVLARAE